MSDMNNPSDENSGALDDLWADALNEQNHPGQKRGGCGIPAIRRR
jgi:flagellar motor switch protein FliN/FliY